MTVGGVKQEGFRSGGGRGSSRGGGGSAGGRSGGGGGSGSGSGSGGGTLAVGDRGAGGFTTGILVAEETGLAIIVAATGLVTGGISNFISIVLIVVIVIILVWIGNGEGKVVKAA